MSAKIVKNAWDEEELTCKPLDSVEELALLLQEPPAWRSLVAPLVPHSTRALKNADINPDSENAQITVQNPQTFCHFESSKVTDVKRYEKKNMPLTMICHDMANGYHDDSFVDGTGNHDAYTFYNWAGIDVFCYFSHHFITIPPLGWINVGHAHGVKVIGTIITEWTDGEAIWDQILASESEWKGFASRLAAAAKIMKFDGWLLNVENKIKQPGALVQFVRFLHAALRQELPAPLLLWYDSVTVDGSLHWQNGLNEKNHAFFSACDGIFTNYSWSERDVAASAAAAGARLRDVFVGIDIWGRNFHGGGQFNTQEAVKVAHKHGCSLAIFAQAWTHEAIPEGAAGAGGSRLEQFLLRERALWGSLWPFLTTRLPSRLPFQTSFCRGQGVKRRLYGEVLGPVPWYNLRHQQYQPGASHGPHGYILTTLDNVLRVAEHGIARDSRGKVKYREAFLEASSSNLNQTGMLNLAPTNHVIFINEHENQQDNEVEQDEPAPAPPGDGGEKPKDVVTKVFSVKTRSSNDLGTSSVQLSVHLQAHDPKSKTTIVRYGLVSVPGEPECLQPYFADSFTGGSCLKVNSARAAASDLRTIRLFHSDFDIDVDATLVVCVVTKTLPGFHDQYLDVILHLTDAGGQEGAARLVGGAAAGGGGVGRHWRVGDVFPVNAGAGSSEQFRELQKYLLLNEPGFYVPTENSHGWTVRYYRARLGGACVTSVNVRGGAGAGGPALLGHIGLCQMPEDNIKGRLI